MTPSRPSRAALPASPKHSSSPSRLPVPDLSSGNQDSRKTTAIQSVDPGPQSGSGGAQASGEIHGFAFHGQIAATAMKLADDRFQTGRGGREIQRLDPRLPFSSVQQSTASKPRVNASSSK